MQLSSIEIEETQDNFENRFYGRVDEALVEWRHRALRDEKETQKNRLLQAANMAAEIAISAGNYTIEETPDGDLILVLGYASCGMGSKNGFASLPKE